ncbi:MAG: hypothetical protein HDS65_02050 [Bacteroidales bacterium]|nr:hypothetical protein [Bacteroidales bacterium]
MLKKHLISLIALLPALQPAVASDIITEQPAGKVLEYYADFENFDNLFGFMGDYHSAQKIVFADDNTVYFPNLLLRREMPAYVKGTYDKEAKTITVEAGQWVFYFPNVDIPVALYTLNSLGQAGPSETEFYTQPLVFDVADDGVISLRSSEAFPMFGICNATNSVEVYQNAKDLRFIPADNVDSQLSYYSYSYVFGTETAETLTTAAGYKEGDDTMWVKGFVPKYPDSWVKLEKTDGEYSAKSFQVQAYFANDEPIAFSALLGQDLPLTLPVAVDESTKTITAADGDVIMSTVTSDGSSYDILTRYHNLVLTPTEIQATKPAAPTFISYDLNSSGETEFIFASESVDTAGESLPKDCLSFRFYIDGEPYVFTPADYRWINSDMALVPYTFSNYNFFSQGGDHNERRYVYLQNLSADVKTIGVELVYTLAGETEVSDRLVYDIATGTVSSGVEDVVIDNDSEVRFYNLQGLPVEQPVSGNIYIRRQGKTTSKVVY